MLDRLLEEPWISMNGLAGTSAGAMNAAVLSSGFARVGTPHVATPVPFVLPR
ncbi:hypothetical protein [Thiocapsa imhoffii]|uniref:hypothetical protein n=1 Tax=Thiocapsa imhoffii TaxID=382777 RepID=UPI0030B86D35